MIGTEAFGDSSGGLIPPARARVTDNSGGALASRRGGAVAFDGGVPSAAAAFRTRRHGDSEAVHFQAPGEGLPVIPLLLILLLLAIVLGGFFVFTLKVAVIVAIVLLLAGMFGSFGYRGRRTV
jgi:hypothetical protein